MAAVGGIPVRWPVIVADSLPEDIAARLRALALADQATGHTERARGVQEAAELVREALSEDRED